MSELFLGPGLESQVATRHHAAADELSGLAALPDLGPGPGTLAMLRIFAAVLGSSQELAVTSTVTAEAVRQVAHVLVEADLAVQHRIQGLA